MAFSDAVAKILGFRAAPTTILILIIHLAVAISVLVTDQLPNVPRDQRGLNLDEAYADLHEIAARPHPYNSHANDLVHSFLLDRVRAIAKGHNGIHIADDTVSNGSWGGAAYGVYFEGNNILVKVDGTDPKFRETGGVLASAHLDSVSTASGATDDGMGVATLLQLLQYFVDHRPKRTVVFNINNGEEDWLNGAHAFLRHPWSNITQTFLNLEGAAAGGRPLLFRATSGSPLLSFKNKFVPHPHANSLSSDAFSRGVIRSGTDFSVYHDGADMQGLDLAFYKGRSKYHTKYDAIPHTDGEKKALWAMMEAALGSSNALANNDGSMHDADDSPPVYFDLFGAVLVLFPLSTLITFNIVFLVVGPITLLLIMALEAGIQHRRRPFIQNGNAAVESTEESMFTRFWDSLIHFHWLSGFWQWAKFWIALGITIASQVLLVWSFIGLNTFMIYSAPFLVLTSSFSLTYLTMVAVLNLPIPGVKAHIPEIQKQSVLVQTYVLSWILLVCATVAENTKHVGGFYFASALNALTFLACSFGCIEAMLGARGTNPVVVILEQPTPADERASANFEEADEHTPLIPRTRHDVTILHDEETGAIGWWILQMLLVVPIPIILIAHIAVLLVGALPQTLADGNSAITVYAAFALLSVFMVLPIAPFAFKMHNALTTVIALVFIVTTLSGWFLFPFNIEAPLKTYFLQNVTILPDGLQATTTLTGVPQYVNTLIDYLPSAYGKERKCIESTAKLALSSCQWESDLLPVPSVHYNGTYLDASVKRTGKHTARISINGTNTRSCRVYFTNNTALKYHVLGSDQGMQPRFEIPADGVKELRVWSRTWDREFVVDVELKLHAEDTEGRVSCEWNEYTSGTIGQIEGGRIPAFEEVVAFLPKWAAATKLSDGLVEVSKPFLI
ncbi:hypothetical protein CYLTODRAFT_434156 [Cylindrobasidium torrendii FP15055 ss-10]|uniref:Peptide hydrolase n=1 Tax=Cylindrobasidium torrendii FP15055 ss-10 TaxID=1314674 RepID=A0A0D7BT96_9AGAR|nr:hypothetical protein CYLTODRAFT_434156 [Cylindrobasidium torrendii FP15055 ss-10]